jgi:prophage maintenance system killer protein
MGSKNEKTVLEFIKLHPSSSSMQIHEGAKLAVGYSTTKRIVTKLIKEGLIVSQGKGKGTKYFIAPSYELLVDIDLEKYFEKEIDEREIRRTFNFSIMELLSDTDLFTDDENKQLNELQKTYERKVKELSLFEYEKELERLAIDLSWKSSQIEGNTYSLLETERLLKEKETAANKGKDEAVMLLNHKDALDFIIAHSDYIQPLTLAKIENIHSILVKELGINKNIRKARVGISGTNYTPLDNDFQIKEALNNMCALINTKKNVFEQALLLLVLISYIQPFADGNKRTARIISNALLINQNYCPISFRTVDSIDYKKAMLLFYEQNNLSSFKKIFVEQFKFAVSTYF